MLIDERQHTLDEYTAIVREYPDKLLELIDGRIVEKVTSERHGKIAGWIVHLLILYLQQYPNIKGHWSVESSYRPVGETRNERRPDVSFRLSDEAASDATYIEGMPDFIVEIKSANNSQEDRDAELRRKAQFYLQHRARLVWLIYPEPKLVEVYRADGTSAVYKEGQQLNGGAVLPDFVTNVSDLFNV